MEKLEIIPLLSIILLLMWIIGFIAKTIYYLFFVNKVDYDFTYYIIIRTVFWYIIVYLAIYIGVFYIAINNIKSEAIVNSIIILVLSIISILLIATHGMMLFIVSFLRGKKEKRLKSLLESKKYNIVYEIGNFATTTLIYLLSKILIAF